MSRKNDYRSFYQLVAMIIAFIGFAIKFLYEVNKHGLWKQFFISGFNFIVIGVHLYKFTEEATIPFEAGVICGILLIISYCAYWANQFKESPYNQFSRQQIKQNSSNWQAQSWWWTLDGWQFEEEVAKIFILYGYKATVTKGSGDGGVDIVLKKDNYTAIVQCKHYNKPVPPEPVRALWGCKDDFNADEVILVASSGVTESSANFINNKQNYKLLVLDDIIRMSKEVQHLEQPIKKEKPIKEDKNVIEKVESTPKEEPTHKEEIAVKTESTEKVKPTTKIKSKAHHGRKLDI